MKKKLIYITDKFPYGIGETPFIKPEIAVLKEKFDITIISKYRFDNLTTQCWNDVKVYRCSDKVIFKDLFRYSLKVIFTSLFWKEIFLSHSKGNSLYKSFRILFPQILKAYKLFDFMKELQLAYSEESVIFYSYWFNYATITLTKLKKELFPNAVIITRTHGYDLYDERSPIGYQPFQKALLPEIRKIIFTCKTSMQYYMQKYPFVEKGKFMYSYLGTNTGTLKLFKKDNVFTVVSCSNLIPLKRVHLIIDALYLLDSFEIKWIHFGGGGLYNDLCLYAENKLQAKKNIRYQFMGYRNTEEITNFYATENIDCFISVSETEGLPVSIMEALAYGLPIIATNVGGICEQVNKNGILLEKDITAEQISKALQTLHDLPENKINEMRNNSFQLWSNLFDIKKNSSQLAETLSEIIE